MGKNIITNIKINKNIDIYADTSFLGEYTDDIGPGVIVRQYNKFYEDLTDDEKIHTRGREFRGFKPYAGGEEVGTEDYKTYGMQDYKRMEQINNGEVCFYGIIAEATIKYKNGDRLETLTSGGLWGIESDCGEYFKEVAKDQLDELMKHLKHFNVNTRNFKRLAKEALEDFDY